MLTTWNMTLSGMMLRMTCEYTSLHTCHPRSLPVQASGFLMPHKFSSHTLMSLMSMDDYNLTWQFSKVMHHHRSSILAQYPEWLADCRCHVCGLAECEWLLLCDGCNKGFHLQCTKPRLHSVPDGIFSAIAYCATRVASSSMHQSSRRIIEADRTMEASDTAMSKVCCLPAKTWSILMLSVRTCCSAGDWYCHECHIPQKEVTSMTIAGEAIRQPMAAAVQAPSQSKTAAAAACAQATAVPAEPLLAAPCAAAASPSDSTGANAAAAGTLMEMATGSSMPPVVCKTEHDTTAHDIAPVFPEREPFQQIASLGVPTVKEEKDATDAHPDGTAEEEQGLDESSVMAELGERVKRADAHVAELLREHAEQQVEPHVLNRRLHGDSF